MKRGRSAIAPSGSGKRAALTALAAATGAPVNTLFRLGDDTGLVRAVVVQRPSSRNKSPYVGDVQLPCGRIAIAHMPSMDMGGKCVPGVEVLLRPQVDKASGKPIGPDVLGKYGTPKCEFITQLLLCTEPENAATGTCWVGAHPSLGERAAHALLSNGVLTTALGGGAVEKVEREVTGVAGTDMRCDFLVTHADATKTVLEVKTVVDSDYNPAFAPERAGCVFLGHRTPYQRAAIFPWGKSNQKGPEGEKVVSARAIKHVRELTEIAKGARRDADGTPLRSAILFVVVRSDVHDFRPNEEACPSFARYLRDARTAGVSVIARRVCWQETQDGDKTVCAAVDGGRLEVDT